jgi:hypothetical protein
MGFEPVQPDYHPATRNAEAFAQKIEGIINYTRTAMTTA